MILQSVPAPSRGDRRGRSSSERASVAAGALLLALAVVSLPAAPAIMPVDEVRPGMEGIGLTVFEGNRPEEFQVRILGVLENVMGPRRNLVLARLDGGPLEKTGVIQGMSGSPVYIDGRLLGAVSYSLGAFSREPIAGITPIAEMTEATASDRLVARRRPLAFPLSAEGVAHAMRDVLGLTSPFARRTEELRGIGLSDPAAASLGLSLRPIATPLSMGGFDGATRDLLWSAFQDAGFVPVMGGFSPRAETATVVEPLRPGDAVGVSLITGDLSLGATGTVTMVDGDKVYGFGHPFFNLGPTQLPMTRAYVHTLLPSLFTSMKVAAMGEIIGTIEQDRATAIAGRLGSGPPLIPMSIALETDRGLTKSFRFGIVNDHFFTPLLTYAVIANTLQSYERQFGAATFALKGRAVVKGHGAVDLDDVFTGDAPSVGAATYVMAPITVLLRNDLAPVEIEEVSLTIASTEQPRIDTLERVWLDEARPRAGRTVPLKVLTRSYRGEETLRTLPLAIPAGAAGTLTIVVADGARLAQMEQREARQPSQAQSIDQMIRVFNNARRNNRLYVKLLKPGAGAVVNGEALTSLPPSVLAVFEADRSGGSYTPLRNATVGEWEIPTDSAVKGSRTLTITIDAS